MKIIAIDLDHTLLATDNTISDSNKVALEEAYHSGVTLAIATGRMPQSVRKIMDPLKNIFSCYICYNGAFVENAVSGTPIYQQHIKNETLHSLLATNNFRDCNLAIFSGDEVYAFSNNDAVMEYYRKRTGAIIQKISGIEDLPASSRIHKFFIYPSIEADNYNPEVESVHEKVTLDRITAAGIPSLSARRTRLGYVECTSEQVSKWAALANVYGLKSLEDYRLMAVGDGYNDLEMIREATLGVAVSNAIPEVQAEADIIVNNNSMSGVAEAIKTFLTLEL